MNPVFLETPAAAAHTLRVITALAAAAILSASALAQTDKASQAPGAPGSDAPAAMIGGGTGDQYISGFEAAANAPQSPQPAAPSNSGASSGNGGGFGGGNFVPFPAVRGLRLAPPGTSETSSGGSAPATGGSLIGSTVEWTRPYIEKGRAGWSTDERYSACGLIAAEGLLRFAARDPHLDRIDKIKGIAAGNKLWDGKIGMHGLNAEVALLKALNINVLKKSLASVHDDMVGALAKGKPVILTTTNHYWVVQGYSDGKFFVGNTGYAMGGKPKMTVEEIALRDKITGLLIPDWAPTTTDSCFNWGGHLCCYDKDGNALSRSCPN